MGLSDIEKILNIVSELNKDEFRKVNISERKDLNDAITELEFFLKAKHKQDRKIDTIINHLIDYSNGDFSQKLEVSDDEDQFDVICMGLNTFVEELRENAISIETFDEVFKSISSPFFIVELKENIFTKYNKAALECFDYKLPNLYKIPIEDVIPDNFFTLIKEFSKSGKSSKTFQQAIIINGKLKHLIVNLSRLDASYYTKNSIAVFLTDITNQIENKILLQESEEKFRSLFELSPLGIALIDYRTSKFIDFNNTLLEYLNYSKEELSLLNNWDITPEEYRNQDFTKIKGLKHGVKIIPYEKELFKKDGSLLPVLVNGIKIKLSNGVNSFLAIIQDITPQKKAEKELILAKTTAEKANMAKSQFLANMSHEMRTPLNGIIGFSNLTLKTNLDATQEEYISTIEKSANSLLSIINDILDFSKIEAGKLELHKEKVDLSELIDECFNIVKYQALDKDLELIIHIDNEVPEFLNLDKIRIRQILINLLGNAVKFTENGEIELSIRVEKKVENTFTLSFSIRDTGVGISDDAQEKVFEAFMQEDNSSTRKYGGTGLGLSICKQLLALMDSTLVLKSEKGKGSVFSFQVEVEGIVDSALIGSEKETTNEKKILLLEKNKRQSAVLSACLKNLGFKIDTIAKVNLIDKYFIDNHPDIFIFDTDLLLENGENEIASLFKKLPEIPIKSIAFSKKIENKNKYDGLLQRFKVKSFLTKPINPFKLKKNITETVLDEENDNVIFDRTFSKKDSNNESEKQQIKFLIVEDNAVNMFLTKTIIKNIYPESIVLEAENGLIGFNQFEENTDINLILMDVQMPVMNGYEATRKIRNHNEKGSLIPIIAVTAGILAEDKEKCLKEGMSDYLSKPVSEAELVRVIKKWSTTTLNAGSSSEQDNSLSSFNKELLLEVFKQDQALTNIIVKLAVESLELALEESLEAIRFNDRKKLQNIIHKAKGTALSTYFNKLTKELNTFEEYIFSSKNNVELAELFERVEEEIIFLKEELT